MTARVVVTRHAQERAQLRLGLPAERAEAALIDAFQRSQVLLGGAVGLVGTCADRLVGRELRLAGGWVLVCRGQKVLTVWGVEPHVAARARAWRPPPGSSAR